MSIDLNLEPLEATIGAGALIVNDYRITTEPIDGGHRITVTRGSEVQTIDLLDGAQGAQGETGPAGPQGDPGQDAPQDAVLYTPQTLTTEQQAQARENIGAADVVAVNGLKGDVDSKLTEPTDGLAVGKYFRVAALDANGHAVLEAVDAKYVGVQDVQVDGASVVADGVASVPVANGFNKYGLFKISNNITGIDIYDDGYLRIEPASDIDITKRQYRKPLSSMNLDFAVKAAMCDGKGKEWTADEQAVARERMGIDDSILSVDPIITQTLSEDVSEFTINLQAPLQHVFITVTNTTSFRVYAGIGLVIEDGYKGLNLITDYTSISQGHRGFVRIDIFSGAAFAYWGSAPKGYQSTSFKFLNRTQIFKEGISKLKFDSGQKNVTLAAGAEIQIWGC